MSNDHWHYPRRAFTQQTFSVMVNGPSKAFTLFGPRRTGKTEWLRRDLGFVASEVYGHRVAYATFWQTPSSPLANLTYRLGQALEPRGWGDRLANWSTSLPVRARVPMPTGGVTEIDLSAKKTELPADDLRLLDQYCSTLANPEKPAFLLLDEVQEIARHPQGDEIIATLRSTLDQAGNGIVSVFTGSSQAGLRALFSAKDAPFFRFATPLTLPPFGDDFIDHQLEQASKTFKRKADRALAKAQFEAYGGNPELFQMWLTNLGLYPDLSYEDVSELTDRQLVEGQDFNGDWLKMTPRHRQYMRLLAERVAAPMGDAGAQFLRALGVNDVPSSTQLQSAQRTLNNNGFIDQWDGDWVIADPAFERWILNRPAIEFTSG